MRKGITLPLFLLCLLSPGLVRADPYYVLPDGNVVFNVVLATQGVFTCLRSIPCSGSGTSSVTLGSGPSTATLTFTGVDTAFGVTNRAMHVDLGTIQSSAAPGFTFPAIRNPQLPVLRFDFTMTHSSPVEAVRHRFWGFGPGGGTDIKLLTAFGAPGSYAGFPAGANPPGLHYTGLVYSFAPYPFRIPANGSVNLGAEVGAVPEPATLLLLGGSLAGAAYARRRKRR